MLVVRGLVVALGGFAFVFLPGAVIAVLTRRDLRFETTLLLWGMGLLVVTLFPAYFVTSLLRMIVLGERTPGPTGQMVVALLGSVLAALFLEGGQYLLLRWRRIPEDDLFNSGVMIGLGIGLLTNVFQGLGLIGSGMRLLFGDTSTPDLAAIAAQAWPALLTNLLALNVYRIALVAIGAALGGLVARALITTRARWLWLAVALGAAATWSYTAIGLSLGSDSLAGSVVVIVYEGLLAALALFWLTRQTPQPAPQQPESKKKRAPAP
jgi:hypothetical protein